MKPLITLAFSLRNVFMPQIQSVPLEREGENNYNWLIFCLSFINGNL